MDKMLALTIHHFLSMILSWEILQYYSKHAKWAGDPKSNCELWGHGDLIANYLQNLIGVINKLSM